MDILFVGVACTDKAIKESNEKYYGGRATVRPQQYFDLNLVKGLSETCRVRAVSEPPVASYPKSKCFWYSRKKEILSEHLTIKYISLVNILGFKTIIISLNILIESIRFCLLKNRSDSAILFGYLSFYSLFPVKIISKLFGFKVFAIVPDVPEYANSYAKSNSIIRLVLNYTAEKLNRLCQSNFDGYIFITKYMNDLINRKKKPYLVIEGFINLEEMSSYKKEPSKDTKIIMYAGTLHEKFGIKKLVDAFKLITKDNLELWIYGEGDYLNKIREEAEKNSKLKYQGTKSKDEIIQLESNVTLLINPRPSDEEFTKYSFPSKILEYMSSGTPVLTTKLLGIPEEYLAYLYVIENEDVEALANTIETILLLPEKELIEFGKKAKEFVEKNKNHQVQSRKICTFIKQ